MQPVEWSKIKKGGLKKYGDYVEVTFSGDKVYETCVDKVIDALGWEYNPVDGSPYLCCLNGSRIIDIPIDTEGVCPGLSQDTYTVFLSAPVM